MSADAQAVSPNTRKRSRATMQATDPAPSSAQEQQPSANDGFVVDQDAGESGGDEDDEEGGKSDKKAGRRKIKIEFIQDKSRRHITFSKRKAGKFLMPLSYVNRTFHSVDASSVGVVLHLFAITLLFVLPMGETV